MLAVAARMVMGFSLGGEVGPTTAFLLEAAPVPRRGFMVACQAASQAVAATSGSLVGLILAAVMKPGALDAYGWRIAFLLGAVAVPFGLWARRGLPETLHEAEDDPFEVSPAPGSQPAGWQSVGSQPAGSMSAARRDALRHSRRILLLGLVVLAYATIATYVVNYLTTYAQATLHMSTGPAFAVAVVSNLARLIGSLFGGWLSDRIGRRPVMIWPNLVTLLITYPLFRWIVESRTPLALLASMGLFNLIGSMTVGGIFVALTESLPKSIRGGAFATIYAVAIATFGGTCQLVVAWLTHVTGDPMAPAWYLLAAIFVGQIAMQMIPESAPAAPPRAQQPGAFQSSPRRPD